MLLLAAVVTSCKKDQEVLKETSSITIVNCMTTGNTIFPALTDPQNLSFSSKVMGLRPLQEFLTEGFAAKIWGLNSGTAPLKIYVFPDSLSPAVTQKIDLKAGDIYSLYVTGDRNNIDTLLVKDSIPHVAAKDSMIIVRFVNLIKDGVPLSVNIVDEPAIPAIENIGYKSVTPYQVFRTKKASTPEECFFYFELRNALTHELISTFKYQWYSLGNGNEKNQLSKTVTGIIQNYLGTPTCTMLSQDLMKTNLN